MGDDIVHLSGQLRAVSFGEDLLRDQMLLVLSCRADFHQPAEIAPRGSARVDPARTARHPSILRTAGEQHVLRLLGEIDRQLQDETRSPPQPRTRSASADAGCTARPRTG